MAGAVDLDGTVTNVEFYAGSNDLGLGVPVVLDPPGAGGVTGLVYLLDWLEVPTNQYSLTAVATDNAGAATTSAPVNITVLTGPPPTNLPPIVRIINPPNGSVFRAPVNIPIYAYAAEPDGTVANVEFFAGHQQPRSRPPGDGRASAASSRSGATADFDRGSHKLLGTGLDQRAFGNQHGADGPGD